jgi:hypothetical protein
VTAVRHLQEGEGAHIPVYSEKGHTRNQTLNLSKLLLSLLNLNLNFNIFTLNLLNHNLINLHLNFQPP